MSLFTQSLFTYQLLTCPSEFYSSMTYHRESYMHALTCMQSLPCFLLKLTFSVWYSVSEGRREKKLRTTCQVSLVGWKHEVKNVKESKPNSSVESGRDLGRVLLGCLKSSFCGSFVRQKRCERLDLACGKNKASFPTWARYIFFESK